MKEKKAIDSSKKTTEKSIKKDEKTLWIKRKSDWLMDDLGKEIINTLIELDFDEEYIQDKQSILAGKNRFAVLLWCNELDASCTAALAERLGIEVDDFSTTLKTLTKL